MEGKLEVKVAVLVLLLVFVEGSSMGDPFSDCMLKCLEDNVINCIAQPQVCLPNCATKCAIELPSNSPATTSAANYTCNFGCALTQCKNFMIQNDAKKLGGCMASCSDKYCAQKAAAAS